jgi:hypothetical protein
MINSKTATPHNSGTLLLLAATASACSTKIGVTESGADGAAGLSVSRGEAAVVSIAGVGCALSSVGVAVSGEATNVGVGVVSSVAIVGDGVNVAFVSVAVAVTETRGVGVMVDPV